MALEMSQELPTVSLDITHKASPSSTTPKKGSFPLDFRFTSLIRSLAVAQWKKTSQPASKGTRTVSTTRSCVYLPSHILTATKVQVSHRTWLQRVLRPLLLPVMMADTFDFPWLLVFLKQLKAPESIRDRVADHHQKSPERSELNKPSRRELCLPFQQHVCTWRKS